MEKRKRKVYGGDLEALLSLSDLGGKAQNTSIESKIILISNISPGKYQPRKHFEPSALNELVESIKVHGIIQPLIIREINAGSYEIIAGERRWRAAKLAGLLEVPALIRDIDDETALAFGIIENIQRKDLNPVEEAHSFKRLLTEFKLTHEEVARSVGRSRATITNMLRLLDLSDPVKSMLEAGKIQMGHAKAMLTLSHELQYQAATLVESKRLSVRETEVMARRISRPKDAPRAENKPDLYFANEFKQELEDRLPAGVSIQMKKGGGWQVILKFDDSAELKIGMRSLLAIPLVLKPERTV